MNYKGKNVAITGHDGFIGSALVKELQAKGANVVALLGDVRDPETFSVIDYTYDYLFHFGAPSSQILFKRQPMNSAEVTIRGFLNAAKACRENGVRLIYPSTGLLSSDRENEYARCKKVCEDIAAGENLNALGIRIFATYGPGEDHKADYASVPFLFARDMVLGRSPVIFGDGQQSRDFIYIDDVVYGILMLAEKCMLPTIDLGSGVNVTFNEIVEQINARDGNDIKAKYTDSPKGYVKETSAKVLDLHSYYLPMTSFTQGIKLLVEYLKSEIQ